MTMTDPIAVKGIELPQGQLTMSDIYVLIVVDFFQLLIKENNKDILKLEKRKNKPESDLLCNRTQTHLQQ